MKRDFFVFDDGVPQLGMAGDSLKKPMKEIPDPGETVTHLHVLLNDCQNSVH